MKTTVEENNGKYVEEWDLPLLPYDKIIDVTPKPIMVKDTPMIQILVPAKPDMQIDLTFWDKARIIGDNASAVWKFFKLIYPIIGSIIIIINWLKSIKKERT